MRVVVDAESLRDAGEADLSRHKEMLSRFLDRLAGGAGEQQRNLTLIVRSGASGAVHALIGSCSDLAEARVSARAILAKLEPSEDLRKLVATLSALSPAEPVQQLVRWARNPRLLDAHEQVIYGGAMCWSGDSMRRDAGKRNALTLFNEDAPEAVRLGQLAFEALWLASVQVPARHLAGPAERKPSGTFELFEPAAVNVSPLKPLLEAWPLVRH